MDFFVLLQLQPTDLGAELSMKVYGIAFSRTLYPNFNNATGARLRTFVQHNRVIFGTFENIFFTFTHYK